MQMFMSSKAHQINFRFVKKVIISFIFFSCLSVTAKASDFNYAWRNKEKALVIDAYEKNPIDWLKMVTDKRIRGFIAKSSDGMPSPWACSGNRTEQKLCKKSFQNYWMKQQLYHTRKLVAKQLGLKWGAYHLGRPGNPIAQANHFINFAKPEADELIALDIEHDDPKKWISFADAEIFAKQVYKRIGRYPVLYTNHDTAKRIAARRSEFPVLSRMQLWYARFKGDIRGSFPIGNWDSYTLWQFSAHPNCNKRRCLYRVPGTETNIDVNVSTLSIAEFDKAWPFNGLVPKRTPKPEVFLVENETPVIDTKKNEVSVASTILVKKDKPELSDAIELSKEASFQLASINLEEIAIPLARKRDDQPKIEVVAVATDVISVEAPEVTEVTEAPEVTEVAEAVIEVAEAVVEIGGSDIGITTTEYEPEYEVVIPKSEHAEDQTMQLQYLSGAL